MQEPHQGNAFELAGSPVSARPTALRPGSRPLPRGGAEGPALPARAELATVPSRLTASLCSCVFLLFGLNLLFRTEGDNLGLRSFTDERRGPGGPQGPAGLQGGAQPSSSSLWCRKEAPRPQGEGLPVCNRVSFSPCPQESWALYLLPRPPLNLKKEPKPPALRNLGHVPGRSRLVVRTHLAPRPPCASYCCWSRREGFPHCLTCHL